MYVWQEVRKACPLDLSPSCLLSNAGGGGCAIGMDRTGVTSTGGVFREVEGGCRFRNRSSNCWKPDKSVVSWQPGHGLPDHSMRCYNKVELNLWYVIFCAWVSTSIWQVHCRSKKWSKAIWVDRGWMEGSWATGWCLDGEPPRGRKSMEHWHNRLSPSISTRSWSMQHSSFLVPHPTLPMSFLSWTISTTTLQQEPMTYHFPQQFAHHLD